MKNQKQQQTQTEVTICADLLDEAEKHGINLSALLEQELRRELKYASAGKCQQECQKKPISHTDTVKFSDNKGSV